MFVSEDRMTPFFSIIIPTYNRAQLLKSSLKSVINQTFSNFEVLVVDDHSTDETRSVVASLKDARIEYILNDRPRGGAGTRNSGIFRARGEWVAFLDDDDVWMPNKLELQYKRTTEIGDSVGLIYSGFIGYDFKGREKVFLPRKEELSWNDLFYRNYIGTYSTVAIRTKLLRGLGGLDERFPAVQDRELYVRVCRVSEVACINEVLAKFSMSDQNRISSNYHKRLVGNLLFRTKYQELIKQNYRLRHIWAARIFLYATLQKDMKQILNSLPWTLAGLFLDPPHLYKIIRRLVVLCVNHA